MRPYQITMLQKSCGDEVKFSITAQSYRHARELAARWFPQYTVLFVDILKRRSRQPRKPRVPESL